MPQSGVRVMNRLSMLIQHLKRGFKWPVTRNQAPPAKTRRHGIFLVLARSVWIAAAVLTIIFVVVSIPLTFAHLQTKCTSGACLLTPTSLQQLAGMGLSVGFFAAYLIAVDLLFVVVSFAVGGVIFWRRWGKSNEYLALFVALTLVTFGTMAFLGPHETFAGSASLWRWLFVFVVFFGNTSSILFFYLFPDGRFVPRWMSVLAVVLLVLQVHSFFFADVLFLRWLTVLDPLENIFFLASIVFAQVYRYWRVSNPVQRQQTKWVVFGVAAAVVGFLGQQLVFPLLGLPSVMLVLVGQTVSNLALLCIPLSIGIAILRYRLWDINLLINRTLVYGILTISVVVIYVLVVGSLGILFQTTGNLLISLVATSLVAVLFQPLRHRLQQAVNHLTYGDRDDPYKVISRLGQRVEETLTPEAVLPTIVETVAQALKLPYAAITVKQGESFTIAASYSPSGKTEDNFSPLQRLPLAYQAEQVGELVLAPRTGGATFSTADRRLLEDLAHQIGVAVHAVSLTADLHHLTVDLQHSRERLVIAREEERRRLRRDLHDGIGPTLASLFQRLDTARRLVPHDPDAAIVLLDALKGQVKATIADIRRVVYALRPPVLDELGLVSAIREHAAYPQASNGLHIAIEAPEEMPLLPAAVEVAAYRIVLEALTNVERHAHAHTCLVRLELIEVGVLRLDITDDGSGLPEHSRMGVGLTSMRERAAELGGECNITSEPTQGTHVWVRLPLSKE
jgi:signal transduction histidine kinase